MSEANRIPAGYYFRPTDLDLLIHYLRPKNNGEELPSDVIEEINLYNGTPWCIMPVADYHTWQTLDSAHPQNKTLFLFAKKGSKVSRIAGNGTWTAKSGPKIIFEKGSRNIAGYKRKFVLELNNMLELNKLVTLETIGQWSMIEYSADDQENENAFVLCKIWVDFNKPCRIK